MQPIAKSVKRQVRSTESSHIINTTHPAVDLKSKETVSFCTIFVCCIESSAHPAADDHAADSWSSEESVAAALWE